MRFPVRSFTKQQLHERANPSLVQQPEATAWDLYDTQLYTSAATTRLTFFQVTNVDPTVTNMEAGGQLVAPKYFQWFYAYLDVLRDPTESTAGGIPQLTPGALDDVQSLIMTSRATWTFNLQDKSYGPFPLSRVHSSGGQVGFATAIGTLAAPNSSRFEYANNGDPATTWCWDGSIMIQPTVGFSVVLNWPAAVTLTSNVQLRFIMSGTQFRAVR